MYRLLGRNPDWHRPVTLPAIDFVDRNGRHWTGESFRGRPLVLNFWFSLCPPCLKEISELNTWRDTFPEVNFVAVNHEKTDVVVRTIERTGFEWPQVVEDSVMTTWLPRESFFPVHAVIDHNGYVRCIEFGGSREIHRRVLDTLRAVIVNGPLTAPRHYKELHHPDEYHSE